MVLDMMVPIFFKGLVILFGSWNTQWWVQKNNKKRRSCRDMLHTSFYCIHSLVSFVNAGHDREGQEGHRLWHLVIFSSFLSQT